MEQKNTAVEEVFRQSYQKAYRAAKAVCMDAQLAEDAVSEALMRLMHAMRKRMIENAQAYFVRIAVNEAKRAVAKRREIPSEAVQEYLDAADGSVNEGVEYKEAAAELLRTVEQLAEKFRMPVKLHYYGGFPEKEVAEMLGISYSAVKTRLFRARQKLKQALERENGVYGGSYDEI